MGLCWIAAWMVEGLLKTRWQGIVLTVVSVYMISMAAITYERCKIWYDAVSLWSDMIEKDPKMVFVYENRGMAYLQKGRDDLAFNDFTQAIELNPHFASAYNNRAIIYDKQGKKDLALNDFNTAIEMDPSYVVTYLNRSIFHFQNGAPQKAMADALKAQDMGLAVPPWYLRNLKKANRI
jgi:tetratricopeptide (TPR) repeat protein